MAINLNLNRTNTAVDRVLTNHKTNGVSTIVSFLEPREIALSQKVNKTFHSSVNGNKNLKNSVITAKRNFVQGCVKDYLENRAKHDFFPAPLDVFGKPGINYSDLDKLATQLEKHGGNKKGSGIVGFSNFNFSLIPRYTKFVNQIKPSEILKTIPSKYISGIYEHMWKIKGCPKGLRSGEYAFHDQHGKKSTSAEKARAIRLFLEDEAVKKRPARVSGGSLGFIGSLKQFAKGFF